MLINELPDDCLLAIFDQFNDLHHLIACFKVCLKWSHLIAKRAKKVKYLMAYRARLRNYSPDYVYYKDRDLIDVAGLSTLFPNLIIAEFSERFQRKSYVYRCEDILEFIRKHEPLREMITSCVAMEECCDNLEMLAIDCSKPGILQNCICSKQLSIRDDTLFNLESAAQYRQNLERLQIILNDSYLNGPVLEKLKVVVVHSNVINLGATFYGFQFIDSCPNLQSAHITINSTTLLVDETLKHESLQDLVILIAMNYLGDLINCSKVCIKWNHLVVKRTKKVKYFMEDPDYSSDYVYYRGRGPFDVTCLSTLFPNLKIAEFSHKMERKVEFEDIVAFVKNHESLKGLLLGYFFTRPIEEHCDKLEMLSVDTLDPSIIQNASSIKQLYILICTLDDFKRDAHHFPNLERLHIVSNEAPYSYYDGPVLEKLKIVELGFTFTYDTDICYGFHFMDSCPNLQSAHIFLDSHGFFVDETIKHKCLQDLVIDFGGPSRINWNDLKRLLMKYPNLKHLGLRGARNIKDEHIKRLVHILPNLVLLQVTVCEEITQSAAGYIKDYCEKYGRSIKFYFDENFSEIESDWPQLSTKQEKISRGFDFMKHCFLKFIHRVPNFLIPIDY